MSSYFTDNKIANDNSGRATTNWSTKRNDNQRLRHRPHISNTSNSRGSGYTRYYSSLDADILFGGVFIDEVTNLNFAVQQNAMPIFGYNSYTFDDIALGSRLVQGSFSINFTEANYLTRVQQTMTAISRQTYGKDTPAKSGFTDTDMKIRNTPIWDKGFDIVIGYGERNSKSASEYDQVITLNCCQLTGCQQQLDYNGEPIMETYSFIARDIKFVAKQQYNMGTGIDSELLESSSAHSRTNAEIDLTKNPGAAILTVRSLIDITYVSGTVLVLGGVNKTVFNSEIELKVIEKNLVAEFNKQQTDALISYMDQYNTDKLTIQIKCSYTKKGEDCYDDFIINAKILRSYV